MKIPKYIDDTIKELEERRKSYIKKARKWSLEFTKTKDENCRNYSEWYYTRAFSMSEAIMCFENMVKGVEEDGEKTDLSRRV